MSDSPSPDRDRAPIVSSRDTKYTDDAAPPASDTSAPDAGLPPPSAPVSAEPRSTVALIGIVIGLAAVVIVIFLVIQLLT
jgi:hypothetical protein